MTGPPRRRAIGATVGILLSAALSVWFVWTIEWGALGEAMRQVELSWVAAAACLVAAEFWLRALRWRVLLKPVAPEARVLDLFAATLIGAAANTLLPARAGEVARPLVASRRVGTRISTLVATNVMERVYDIFGLVAVLVAMALVLPENIGATDPAEAELVSNLKLYGGLFGAFALGCMILFFTLASRGERARGLFARLLTPAPPPVRQRFLSLFDGFVEGLRSATGGRGPILAGALSLVTWFNGAAAIYLLFQGFGLALPFGAACFTSVAIALTVALPQGPGFFGVFHVAIEKTMVLWGVDPAPAKAFAIVFWAVSFVPVTTAGLVVLWREGLSLGGIWSREGQSPAPEPEER